MESAHPHPFDVDSAVEAAGDGRWSAHVSDRWNHLGGGPNGGYLAATCLRALGRAMPLPDPVVVSVFFLRPGVHGPAEIETRVTRAGRRVATGEATLSQDGKPRVRLLASYVDLAQANGRTQRFAEPPTLPRPEDSIDPMAGLTLPGVTIADQIEYRVAEPPGWLSGNPSGDPTSVLWARFREPREPDLAALPLIVDAAAPAVLELGEIASVTVELTLHLRAHPAPGWLACRASTRNLIDGIHDEDFEVWDASGRLVAQARQLALLPAT